MMKFMSSTSIENPKRQASVKVVAPESEENSVALPGCFRLEADGVPRSSCGEIHKLKEGVNGKCMGKYGKCMGKYWKIWENMRKYGKCMRKCGKCMGKYGKCMGKNMGNVWEKIWEMCGRMEGHVPKLAGGV
jgi:hypothetical protein